MARWWLVGLVALGACEGGEGAEAGEGAALETSPFVPLLCTDGWAGDPSCPVNHVLLDELGVTAAMTFVAEPSERGVLLHTLHVSAGATGVYLEHPRIIGWDEHGPLPGDGGPFRDLVIAVPPHTRQFAAGTARLVDSASSRMSIEFAALEPLL